MSRDQESPPLRERFPADTHLDDLKLRSIRGGAASVAAQGLQYGVDLLALLVLARWLAPADFGLVAMVSAVVGFVAVFKDAGLPLATVQREQVSEAQVSALFWLNLALSLVLLGVVAALSGAVARFYVEPRLAPITVALGLGFVFSGLEAQHVALLRRRMRFRALAWARAGAHCAGAAAAVAAAFAGWGTWALVLRALVTPAVSMLAAWVLLPWRPLPPWRSSGAAALVRFGGYVTAFGAVNHLGRNFDNLLIGRLFGGASLGLYTKAYGLLLMPLQMINGPISGVAIPALSRLRGQPERMRAYYAKALTMVVTLSMPVVAWLAAVTDSFVLTVLGEPWREAGEIFRILALPAFIGTANVATGWVFVSLGRVREQLLAGCVNTAIGVVAIAIGTRWGVVGVAWALALSAVLRRPPTLAYCYRGTPYRLRDLGQVLWRPATAALAAGAATHLLHGWLAPQLAPPWVLAASLPAFGSLYLGALLGLPGGRALVAEVAGHLRLLGAGGRALEAPA